MPYTQVLLGIYRSGVCLSHDLRRLATFFRGPPAAFAEEGAAATAAGSHADRGRAFFRPQDHRELSDALCTTDGAVGGVLDGRRFVKAVCCVPRHPDAPRARDTRAFGFGQPSAHRRMADLLAESLPGSLKCWRVLTHISRESSRRESALGSRLRQIVAEGGAAVEALPVEGEGASDWGALLRQLRHLGLPAADEWFVRCALIARGGAKALAVRAEARRLAAVLAAVLEACTAFEAALCEAGGLDEPRVSWAAELQRRAGTGAAGTAAAEGWRGEG